MVESAVRTWAKEQIGPPESVVVEGVSREPGSSSAFADLRFSNFSYIITSQVWGTKEQRFYSGTGQAREFSKYTDGRWVLKTIRFGEGLAMVEWTELNVPASVTQAPTDDSPTEASSVEQPESPEPDDTVNEQALALLQSARAMVLSPEPVPMSDYLTLLDNAEKTDPQARTLVAREYRRLLIRHSQYASESGSQDQPFVNALPNSPSSGTPPCDWTTR